jgi:hypothetical protein
VGSVSRIIILERTGEGSSVRFPFVLFKPSL